MRVKKIDELILKLINNEGFDCEDLVYIIRLDRLAVNTVATKQRVNLNMESIEEYPLINGFYVVDEFIKLRKECDYKDKHGRKETHYKYVFDLYYLNELVAFLFIEGSRFNTRGLVKLEFVNRLFYTTGFKYCYDGICNALHLEYKSIANVEIAYDSYYKFDLLKVLLDRSNKKDKEVYDFVHLGKSMYDARKNNGEIIVGDLNVSGKAIVAYDKTREIKKKGKKEYILNDCQLNGLDITRSIHRVELRMTGDYLVDKNITLDDLTTQKGLEEVFRTHSEGNLEFKSINHMEAHRDKQGKPIYKRFSVIDFSKFGLRQLRKQESTLTPTIDITPTKIKERFKTLLYLYIERGNNSSIELLRDYICDKRFALDAFSQQGNLKAFKDLAINYINKHKANRLMDDALSRKADAVRLIFDVPSSRRIVTASSINMVHSFALKMM